MADSPLTIADVKQRLLRDCTRLEQRLQRYQEGGMTVLEIAKFAVYAGYTLVRAVESMDDVSDAMKQRAIQEIIPALYHQVDPDIPGLPSFVESMVEEIVLDMVVKALSQVLLREHYGAA